VTVSIALSGHAGAQVQTPKIFYNDSHYDYKDPLANLLDDLAIATDKEALLPGETATFANYTSYSRGINGIMIDIDGLADTPGIDDFVFRAGNSSEPSAWAAVTALPSITVRPGEGEDGSDRVTLIWPGGTIVNQWVEVTVLSDGNGGGLGLATDDVFYFCNVVADTDGDGAVGVSDYGTLIGEFGRSGDDLATDFNADGRVDLYDFATLRGMYGNSVSLPTFLPAAPEASTATLMAAIQVAAESIAEVETPAAPVVSQPLDDNDANDDSIAATAFAPAVDWAAMSLSNRVVDSLLPGTYISEPQPPLPGSAATTLYHAATAEYDLRPLSDDLDTGESNALLADILAESALALPF